MRSHASMLRAMPGRAQDVAFCWESSGYFTAAARVRGGVLDIGQRQFSGKVNDDEHQFKPPNRALLEAAAEPPARYLA